MATHTIHILPFDGRPIRIRRTGNKLFLNEELQSFSASLPAPAYNSWIPMLERITYTPDHVELALGVMDYVQTAAALRAIKQDMPFAPADKIVNNLSIGIIPVTSDKYVMLTRRNQDPSVHAAGVWNFPGGYMASFFIDREHCHDPEMADNPLLFNLEEQAKRRIHRQEFSGLPDGSVSLRAVPAALAIGYFHSLEPELGWVADFALNRSEMAEYIGQHEALRGVKEHTRLDFVAVEDLEQLLRNQTDLMNVDPITYDTTDPKMLILLDDNMGELLGGAYLQIAGKNLKDTSLGKLRNRGFRLNFFAFPEVENHYFPIRF